MKASFGKVYESFRHCFPYELSNRAFTCVRYILVCGCRQLGSCDLHPDLLIDKKGYI